MKYYPIYTIIIHYVENVQENKKKTILVYTRHN